MKGQLMKWLTVLVIVIAASIVAASIVAALLYAAGDSEGGELWLGQMIDRSADSSRQS
jgi:hypothetical protein